MVVNKPEETNLQIRANTTAHSDDSLGSRSGSAPMKQSLEECGTSGTLVCF